SGPFASSKSPGQKSEVLTGALEMVLDHDSGEMEGRCLKGQFAARMLSSLSDAELLVLLAELRATDAQGASLIEAYLDWRSPRWRERSAEGAGREEARGPRGGKRRMSGAEGNVVVGVK